MPPEPLTIYALPIFQDNYIWLIIHAKEKKVIAVDPGDAAPLQDFLTHNHLTLAALLITHHHADHTNGITTLAKHFPIPVYGPNNPSIPGITHAVCEPNTITFPFLPGAFAVLDTPGHTIDHIAYCFGDALFCGDTLFSAGCGRIFEGTAEQMYHSLQKIAALPEKTSIYCTHEYTLQNLAFAQTIEPHNQNIALKIQQVTALRAANRPSLPSLLGEEKAINPFLRCHIKEVVQRVEQHVGFTLSTPVNVFKYLREWKNGF